MPDVVIASASAVPEDPTDVTWNKAPEHAAKLILQDLVEPRLMKPSTAEVRVRAISDGKRVAFRLQWADETQDDTPKPGQFNDACAVQVPAKIELTVPAPQMGEPNKPVEIVYWNASWQAKVDGRGDSIQDLYPNASVDHYPFEARPLGENAPDQQAMATRYAPARALGNFMAGPAGKSVQDLIAAGPGTLEPASASTSIGRATRTNDGWSVVIVRPLPSGLTTDNASHVAFAVWQGGKQEVGSRKMRTGWIQLVRRGQS
jgi:hypothetical protein